MTVRENAIKVQGPRPINWIDFASRYGTVFAALVIFVVFSIFSPRFLSANNLSNVLIQISALTVVASALTVAVVSGEFDLSVGQVAGLSSMLVAGLLVLNNQPVFAAIPLAILAGLIIGIVNGFLVTKLRIPSLIATLGMGPIALGINYAYSGGDSIYAQMPDSFYYLSTGRIFGFLPVPVLIAIIVVIAVHTLINKTRYGRATVATGTNIVAARLSGINVNRCRQIALVISATGASVAGVMLTARLGTGQPGAGEPYLMDALTAVFIGMTCFRPGRASVEGTIIGVIIIGMLDNGLNLLGAPFYLQNIVRGVVMIAAVALAVLRGEIRFF
jgi:simple sugar transport system permease protein/ribose transport system permease protein